MASVQHDEQYLTTTDGLQLFYRHDRPENARAVIMLLHGLGEHSGRYDHVIERLNTAGYEVFAIDHRGHGRSEGERVFVRTYDEFMDDLERFRAIIDHQLNGHPLIIAGHSMGGNLAVGHALAHPEGIDGLALSGPALQPGDDFNALTQRLVGLLARFAPRLRPQALDAESISRDPAVVEAYLDDPLVYSGKLTAGIAGALLDAMHRFPTRYDELTMPILVLHGTDDQLATVDGSRELEALAINAEVTSHYYEGLYHEVFNEPERDTVIDELITWLDTIR